MNLLRNLPGRLRWAAPAGVVVAVGAVVAVVAVPGAQAAPSLPARTPAQVLASVSGRSPALPPMTATIQETAALGLPALPGTGSKFSPLSLLSGTHTIQLWYGGPAHVRVAIPLQLGEVDLRQDGRAVWLWDSTRNAATGLTLPAGRAPLGGPPAAMPGGALSPLTPQQLARQVLAAIGPTTRVSLQRNVMVAGQASYQLVLAPKDGRSLVGRVTIAIDARRSLPLRVQVFARGASAPAFSLGYTSLAFGRPAASNFAFTPPRGATVKRIAVPAASVPAASVPGVPPGWYGYAPLSGATFVPGSHGQLGGQAGPAYSSSLRLCLPKGAIARARRLMLAHPPKGMSKAMRRQLLRLGPKAMLARGPLAVRHWRIVALPKAATRGWTVATACGLVGTAPAGRIVLAGPPGKRIVLKGPLAGPSATLRQAHGGGLSVTGKGWLSVLVLPAGSAQAAGQASASAGGELGAALNAATPVHGSWGSGRLLRTSLVSVLLTGNGRVLVGAVAPSVLYAAAARAR